MINVAIILTAILAGLAIAELIRLFFDRLETEGRKTNNKRPFIKKRRLPWYLK